MLRSLNGVPRRANPTLQGPAKVLEPDRLRRAREAERLVTIPPDPGRALGKGQASARSSRTSDETGSEHALVPIERIVQWMSGQNGQ